MELLASLLLLVGAVYGLPQVRIGNTTVLGTTSLNVDTFLGIPFAEPPLGDLRLRPPSLATTLPGANFNASTYGSSCPQLLLGVIDRVSEDCLTINIFRPSSITTKRLPVMVWIHGGAFFAGSSVEYPGVNLVKYSTKRGTPVIYVSLNYRLGPLGFPTGSEAATKNVLNLGLHDQIAALQWIRANIGQFGGDKTKVTIFGESAGSSSIGIHLLQSEIGNLARAGIMESPAGLPVFKPQDHEETWKLFVSSIPACASVLNSTSTIECLRKADTTSIVQAVPQMPPGSFMPMIDGPGGLIPNYPSKVGIKPQFPLIVGSNKDEGTIFMPQTITTDDEIRNMILPLFSPPIVSPTQQARDMDIVMKLYPDVAALGAPYWTGNDTFGLNSQFKRAAAIYGDLLLESYRRYVTQAISSAGQKVWGYHFSDPFAVITGDLPPSLAPRSIGVTHSAEIPYVFGSLLEPAATQPSSQFLSTIMQDYWISFANNLDPNDGRGTKRPEWKPYTPRSQTLLNLNGTTSQLIQDDFRSAGISFVNANPLFLLR